ncbi:DUF2653 family protein [Cohnella hashimotonis]|uniref:DUF2653 family protein n=1 Tax=Cohnella hashimotonis TaxID=2826895 RepID=A0ABT6TFG9_9BACL|nr:DUF2653 family protein [Cohnella hashimotonis]MDI4645587.1 DUF2653 family protein [Cohnella hashimotonis]
MRLTTDEIVNAVCLHTSERQQVPVTSVEVELSWDDEQGFTAEVWVEGRSRYLVEANLKESIVRYMLTEYGRRVYPSSITMVADEELEEIFADVFEE